jgi:prepilin-type N-terminal cleavage/methylation domain-containing protein
MRTRRRASGFTLLEMMISLAVFAVVSIILMEMLARQNRTYTVVDNIVETQEKARAVAGVLEQEIRQTGLMMPIGSALCGYDTRVGVVDTDPDVIYVTNTEAITPAPPPTAAQPTSFQRFATNAVPVGAGVGASATQTFQLASLVLDAPAFYDLDGNGTGDSDFRGPTSGASPASQRGGVIIFDPNDPSKGTACGQITNINLATNSITVDFTSGGAVPTAGGVTGIPLGVGYASTLAFVPAHGYWIDVLPPPASTPRLMRDGIVVAEDVEDLQIAAFFDLGPGGVGIPDGIVNALGIAAPPPWSDALEYPGSGALNSWYVAGLRDNTQLREVRVTVVARTRAEDPDVAANPGMAAFFPQREENRVIAGVMAPDGFRRRVLRMTIAPRNVIAKVDLNP